MWNKFSVNQTTVATYTKDDTVKGALVIRWDTGELLVEVSKKTINAKLPAGVGESISIIESWMKMIELVA